MSKLLFLLFYTGYFLAIAPISLWVLLNAPTWVGKGMAVAGLLMLPLPILFIRWYQQKQSQTVWGRMMAVIGLILVGLLVAILYASPSGDAGHHSPIQHRFFREATFKRYVLTNIIPEIEQVNLGFLVMTYLDPFLTREQVNRVSPFTLDLYREMEQDSDFHELGSAMGLAYAELLGQDFDVGHYYLYVPQKEVETPLPAIVFLHGSAGNFKSYSWAWSKLAVAEGFVIIAPSYGFGNWDENGTNTVLEAIEDAKQVVAIDENQIYLAGLSNGGLGVSRLAAAYPDMFQGLIFISPVMATNLVDRESFQKNWANRPVLVLSGEADKRIPIEYIRQRVSNLERGGVQVKSVYYANEDHFLFYSQPERMMEDVANWLDEIEEKKRFGIKINELYR